jgi:putative ABC transport system permease protein
MNQQLIELDWLDLGWTLGLIGLAIALSVWQRLDLEGQLFIGGMRSLLQLLVVGYFIALIFAINHPLAVLGILGVMSSIAAIALLVWEIS